MNNGDVLDCPVSPISYGDFHYSGDPEIVRAARDAAEDRRNGMTFPRQFPGPTTYSTAYMMAWAIEELAEVRRLIEEEERR